MPDVDLLRRLAPPVEPAPADVVERARARIVDPSPRPWHARRGRGLLLAPAALGLAVVLVLVASQFGQGREPAWAAAAVRVAETSPRLLMTGDGWRVKRVDEWAVGTGEMTFGNGAHELHLRWMPTAERPHLAADRAKDAATVAETQVAGARVVVRRYDGTADDYTAVWAAGETSLEARVQGGTPETVAELLRLLRPVDVDGWLSALPATAVTPDHRGSAVDAMLDGLPLPPGLDLAALRASGDATRDRYQLGAQVAGAVACGWLDRWLRATANGDRAGRDEAVRALGTSRHWPILLEMRADGQYPDVLWEYVDTVARGGSAPGGRAGITVAESYVDALGCASPTP